MTPKIQAPRGTPNNGALTHFTGWSEVTVAKSALSRESQE